MTGRTPMDMQGWMRQQEKRARQAEITRPIREVIDPFPYTTGWGQYSAFWMTPKITKMFGEVRLEGLLGRTGATIAATTAGQTVGLLPVGFRPREALLAYVGTEYGSLRIDILTTGDVQLRWLVATAYTSGGFFAPLDTIRYRTAVG